MKKVTAGRRRGGWSRRGRPGRFTYFDEVRREQVTEESALERVRELAIPPAWSDVWISPSSGARLQATGFDAAGRKQYLYHPAYRAAREREKFDRLVAFGEALPSLRRSIAEDVTRGSLTFEWTSAVALTLVNRAWFRPGSERAARTARTYGVTTLNKRHVQVAGRRLTFCFRGKHRVLHRATLVDPELAEAMRRLLAVGGGSRVFRFERDGSFVSLTAPQLNSYLRERFDPLFSVKDFRTWGGTLTAAVALAEHGPPSSPSDAKKALARAYRRVAGELGNTPAVARASYVSPVVIERFQEGVTLGHVRPESERVVSASRGTLEPEEESLVALLRG